MQERERERERERRKTKTVVDVFRDMCAAIVVKREVS